MDVKSWWGLESIFFGSESANRFYVKLVGGVGFVLDSENQGPYQLQKGVALGSGVYFETQHWLVGVGGRRLLTIFSLDGDCAFNPKI